MDKQKELDIYKEQLELLLIDCKSAHGEDLVKLIANTPSLIRRIESLEGELRKE